MTKRTSVNGWANAATYHQTLRSPASHHFSPTDEILPSWQMCNPPHLFHYLWVVVLCLSDKRVAKDMKQYLGNTLNGNHTRRNLSKMLDNIQRMLQDLQGTVRWKRFSLIVIWVSWSTDPLGKPAFRYGRKSLPSVPANIYMPWVTETMLTKTEQGKQLSPGISCWAYPARLATHKPLIQAWCDYPHITLPPHW